MTNTVWRTAVLGSCSWFPALCASVCALSSLWWLPSVKCPTKQLPWRFALDHVNYDVKLSARSASAVEHLLCGNQNRGKGVATFVDYLDSTGLAVIANKCAEEAATASRQLAVRSPVRMPWELSPRLGRVSWPEKGSSINEVIVFNLRTTNWQFTLFVSLNLSKSSTHLIFLPYTTYKSIRL